ncbi:MAG: hypothetical protein M5R38_03690 [Candidatus Methylomirabilis sp.]|nr:hypothetical protein [Candidatus Methylomirabilis sp.]
MKRTSLLFTLILTIGIAVGVIGTQVVNAQQDPMKRTVLIKTDLTGIEGKEAALVLVEFAPGGSPHRTITLEKR